jgi:hypothetical protein
VEHGTKKILGHPAMIDFVHASRPVADT